ncbi:MAG: prepilin-type N-terminal cleavage/methylation domain-containing protein [Firmicutes bacterium]|uniref:General secretion pathway protein G n=1 Tax=Melghirimyces thermohalophilus TaxID=1236220 RepID=A0A1G6HNS6_9BACL|nr:prepilin-type N-terminal cleavage/methylation domain-containing protein [Melghirimyces thermohalophilus]MDA8351978.1 prepilin-type N-terminal cleavage/methylation domain-containing protein [Bacillota bacterium]SDB95535.1 general secretion pathway protein G [Melghirimyces thermohalophilus]
MNPKRVWRDERGFTLIEMLVVLFVIGVIIAIALPNLKAAGESAQEKACDANRKLIGSQADNYYLDLGSYPDNAQQMKRRGYLRTVPTCPAKGNYRIQKDAPVEKRVTCSVHGD